MTEHEIRKCRAAAMLYRQLQNEVKALKTRIAELEEQVAAINQEDAEVIALVRLNRNRH